MDARELTKAALQDPPSDAKIFTWDEAEGSRSFRVEIMTSLVSFINKQQKTLHFYHLTS